MSTPSHRRREGRKAYIRGANPVDRNPYAGKTGLSADLNSADWLAGWREAETHDELARLREEAAAEAEEEQITEFVRLYNIAKDRGLIT